MTKNKHFLMITAAIAACLIFYVDLSTPLGVAIGLPYVFLVLLGLWMPNKGFILTLAVIGTVLTVIGYLLSSTGSEQWIVISNRLLAIFVIWVTAFLIIVRNKAHIESLKNESLLNNVVKHTPLAVITWDSRFCVASWNAAAENIFGYCAEEVIGRHAEDFIIPKDLIGKINHVWDELKQNAGGRRSSNTNLTKHGKVISCEWYNTSLTNDDGEFSGVVSLVMDVTQRIDAENKIKQERNTAQLYLDTIKTLLVVLDKHGVITLINKKGCEILGYDETELVGSNWFDMCLPDSMKDEVKGVFNKVINRDITAVKEYQNVVITKDGEIRAFHFFNNFLENEDNEITGVISSALDVTELNKIQDDLVATKEYAENANRAKSNFLSHMSHELRTPLNAILGYSQLLELSELTVQNMDYVNEIHVAGDHLLEVINEILHLSHIESGKLNVDMGVVDLADVIYECVALIKPLVDQQDITIDNKINNEDNILLEADEIRLKEVILNLLSNAAKYNSSHGKITISCEMTGINLVRITISDTGKGLSNEEMKKLFIPYERFSSDKHLIQGTGIGLIISKNLTELMNGSIGASSEVGKGSEFWIELKKVTK